MGALYEFHCHNCDGPKKRNELPEEEELLFFHRPSGTPLGCGLSYPYVCKSIYQDIRKGKLGPEARKTMFWMRKPGIYHSTDVHVCENCEKWEIRENIKICRLKPGKSDRGSAIDDARDAQAGRRLKPLCYLDRDKWVVVWEKKHSCKACGGRLIPRNRPENLKCNCCGGPLEVSLTGHWD